MGVFTSYIVGMIIVNCFGFEDVPTGLPPDQVPVIAWQAEFFWRFMLGLGLLCPFIHLICIVTGYLPESPHSLILKNRKEQAENVLSLFYQDEYVTQIL